ncbi:hypothetical protein REG_p0026 (plasmid) [Candidatus Regiella insecticola LSR1]|uniref:Uncharacterized protein n=1 Tax=Candidatus Regiella insecticola LSR1 TaxID=663321 RepID=E0R9A9_9ENTR|nr:hypothetical protein REG_p0026 [Candidatus Regiella insecticola LSR1]
MRKRGKIDVANLLPKRGFLFDSEFWLKGLFLAFFTSVKLQNLFGKIIINNIEVTLWYIEDGSDCTHHFKGRSVSAGFVLRDTRSGCGFV